MSCDRSDPHQIDAIADLGDHVDLAEFAVLVEFIAGGKVNRGKLPTVRVFDSQSKVLVQKQPGREKNTCVVWLATFMRSAMEFKVSIFVR